MENQTLTVAGPLNNRYMIVACFATKTLKNPPNLVRRQAIGMTLQEGSVAILAQALAQAPPLSAPRAESNDH